MHGILQHAEPLGFPRESALSGTAPRGEVAPECFWKQVFASVTSRAERGGGRPGLALGMGHENVREQYSRVLLDHTGQVRQSLSRAVFLALTSALLHH